MGKNVAHHIHSNLIHSASSTGGAEASFLAGKCNQAFILAAFALEATKAIRQDSAFQVGFHFANYMGSEGEFVSSGLSCCDESFEVFLERAVKDRFLRFVAVRESGARAGALSDKLHCLCAMQSNGCLFRLMRRDEVMASGHGEPDLWTRIGTEISTIIKLLWNIRGTHEPRTPINFRYPPECGSCFKLL
jgi:hypothetical protein